MWRQLKPKACTGAQSRSEKVVRSPSKVSSSLGFSSSVGVSSCVLPVYHASLLCACLWEWHEEARTHWFELGPLPSQLASDAPPMAAASQESWLLSEWRCQDMLWPFHGRLLRRATDTLMHLLQVVSCSPPAKDGSGGNWGQMLFLPYLLTVKILSAANLPLTAVDLPTLKRKERACWGRELIREMSCASWTSHCCFATCRLDSNTGFCLVQQRILLDSKDKLVIDASQSGWKR